MNEVTEILSQIETGDAQAASKLLPLVYDELHRLAVARMSRESADHTLQPTALVHEAYLRLVGSGHEYGWESRGHFFAAAAESMRRILVEHARRKKRIRHGGQVARADISEGELVAPDKVDEVLAVDEALNKLSEADPVKAELVKLRFFCGQTIAEAAELLGISTTTAERYWTFARAWIHREISKGDESP